MSATPDAAAKTAPPALQTLPSDDLRAIQWRFDGRYDLSMLVQSSRSVARGPVGSPVPTAFWPN